MLAYLENSTKLKIWYIGRGKILEPFAGKKDKSVKNVLLLLLLFKRLYLDSNKSAKWSRFLHLVTYSQQAESFPDPFFTRCQLCIT